MTIRRARPKDRRRFEARGCDGLDMFPALNSKASNIIVEMVANFNGSHEALLIGLRQKGVSALAASF